MKKNLAKLVKKVITDKRGKKTTVWVRLNEEKSKPKVKKEEKENYDISDFKIGDAVEFRSVAEIKDINEAGVKSGRDRQMPYDKGIENVYGGKKGVVIGKDEFSLDIKMSDGSEEYGVGTEMIAKKTNITPKRRK